MALILVVDDAAFMRMRMSKILSEAGYDVVQAENGLDALEKYKLQRPDAVLMDITMPEMDGEETFNALKKIDSTAKVIIVSGFSLQEIEERFNNRGLLGALHKPYTLKELKKILRAHFDDSTPDEQPV